MQAGTHACGSLAASRCTCVHAWQPTPLCHYDALQVMYVQHTECWDFYFSSKPTASGHKKLLVKGVPHTQDLAIASLITSPTPPSPSNTNNHHLTIVVKGPDIESLWKPNTFLPFSVKSLDPVIQSCARKNFCVLPACDAIYPGSVYVYGIYVCNNEWLKKLGIAVNCKLKVRAGCYSHVHCRPRGPTYTQTEQRAAYLVKCTRRRPRPSMALFHLVASCGLCMSLCTQAGPGERVVLADQQPIRTARPGLVVADWPCPRRPDAIRRHLLSLRLPILAESRL